MNEELGKKIGLPDLTHMSDLDLVMMQKECERNPEDRQFREAILIELGRRQKNNPHAKAPRTQR